MVMQISFWMCSVKCEELSIKKLILLCGKWCGIAYYKVPGISIKILTLDFARSSKLYICQPLISLQHVIYQIICPGSRVFVLWAKPDTGPFPVLGSTQGKQLLLSSNIWAGETFLRCIHPKISTQYVSLLVAGSTKHIHFLNLGMRAGMAPITGSLKIALLPNS